jgi:hypothetical protein
MGVDPATGLVGLRGADSGGADQRGGGDPAAPGHESGKDKGDDAQKNGAEQMSPLHAVAYDPGVNRIGADVLGMERGQKQIWDAEDALWILGKLSPRLVGVGPPLVNDFQQILLRSGDVEAREFFPICAAAERLGID